MLDPEELYDLGPDVPELDSPVLLCGLDGFVDAGGIGALVREQVISQPENVTVATFDVDQLIDYRSRRPTMTYVEDHWATYDTPELVLRTARDSLGTPFLLLTGPEPDYQWERFVAAVRGLVERLGVRLTVGFHGIPMAVPHTRPIGLTAHATRPELVAGHTRWLSEVRVPGSVSALLEFRLGQAGHDALGFAAHVPHYLAQASYPAAALAVLDAIIAATGLALPADQLRAAARTADAQIARQVENSDEIGSVVRMLEEQYDSYLRAQEEDMPTADELGAQFEQFLAEHDQHGNDTPDR
ncbi:MAG TPA: PAC2 family protein [Mycobacteriales bacterium]